VTVGNIGLEMSKADLIGGCLAIASLTEAAFSCVSSVIIASSIDIVDLQSDSDDLGWGVPLKMLAVNANLFTAIEDWGQYYYPEYSEAEGGGGYMPWWGSAAIVPYVSMSVNMTYAIPGDILGAGWSAVFGSDAASPQALDNARTVYESAKTITAISRLLP
jgi:hypothetical protein